MARLLVITATLLSLALPGGAHARLLRGDWESVGAPMMPSDPSGEFRYHCQAELTDHVQRSGDGKASPSGPYRLYAMSRFELTPANRFWNGKGRWRWVAKSLREHDRTKDLMELARPPQGAFGTEGVSASIRLFEAGGGQPERAQLSATVELPVEAYRLSQSETKEGLRTEPSIQLRVAAVLRRAEGQPESLPRYLERRLFVVCDKRK